MTTEEFLHQQIPITRAMGLRVINDDADGFTVSAPVALNYNHLHTAFGGSINAVATLAAYGWLWSELRKEDADLVIRDSSIRFFRPIREDIIAVCTRPPSDELGVFKTKLAQHGRANLALSVRVEEGGMLAAELKATFVAMRKPAA